MVTKTFHGAGLVVPVDKNDVGYRELPETDASLRRICRTIVEAPSDADRLLIPEWSSGFPSFLHFKSEFGNKGFMI